MGEKQASSLEGGHPQAGGFREFTQLGDEALRSLEALEVAILRTAQRHPDPEAGMAAAGRLIREGWKILDHLGAPVTSTEAALAEARLCRERFASVSIRLTEWGRVGAPAGEALDAALELLRGGAVEA